MGRMSKKRQAMSTISWDRMTLDKALRKQGLNPNDNKLKHVFKEAYEQIMELLLYEAKERCPVDVGTLEEAIIKKKGRHHDYYKVGYILIDDIPIPEAENGSMWRSDESGDPSLMKEWKPRKEPRTTLEYSGYAHELIQPYGPKNLGPKSKAKQATTSATVGGGFIARAIDSEEVQDVIEAYMEESINKIFEGKK